ncbi:thiolase family protein [Roseibium sp.]|uniref:thiolase family protein n=1 Tax=Roseibium sp. TaxID=1936156 RepID=UPI003A97F5A3
MRGPAEIIAARRTPVAPRGGAFRALQADELAAPVIEALLVDAGIPPSAVDQVVFGNALYGGGNPARMAALRAGLSQSVPAMTIDTQCCSGLDAILTGIRLVEAGAADCVVAGGMESFSRAPIRQHRPLTKGGDPVAYDRPAFAPDPRQDPDLSEAAAALADRRQISRMSQAQYAVRSHQKARRAQQAGRFAAELVPVGGAAMDGFTRNLGEATALRAPVLAGDMTTGVTSATTAVEADAAAAVLIASPAFAACGRQPEEAGNRIRVRGGLSIGGPSDAPALVATAALRQIARQQRIDLGDMTRIELMEAYAVQAMATIADLSIEEMSVNRDGGALARGHPIGASGAILAVRLFHGLLCDQTNGIGCAAIPAAGGLGAALMLETFA